MYSSISGSGDERLRRPDADDELSHDRSRVLLLRVPYHPLLRLSSEDDAMLLEGLLIDFGQELLRLTTMVPIVSGSKALKRDVVVLGEGHLYGCLGIFDGVDAEALADALLEEHVHGLRVLLHQPLLVLEVGAPRILIDVSHDILPRRLSRLVPDAKVHELRRCAAQDRADLPLRQALRKEAVLHLVRHPVRKSNEKGAPRPRAALIRPKKLVSGCDDGEVNVRADGLLALDVERVLLLAVAQLLDLRCVDLAAPLDLGKVH